jgi:dihydropteroate synthase
LALPEKPDVPVLDCAGRGLDLSRPIIMGVINTTPDSFSDGGTLYRGSRLDVELALTRARDMVTQGAAILDIGGESTRPGAAPVSPAEEMDRVLPLVERIAAELEVVTSVDTSAPALMMEAARAGAGLLNDVRALTREGALEAAAATGLPVCLMHMRGDPGTMQSAPSYADVVSEVCDFLQRRIAVSEAQGISRERLLLDPGFGFGKSVEHNLQLLQGLPSLVALGLPVLVGLSRKSFIEKLLRIPVEERLAASLAAEAYTIYQGAEIVRVHDVKETVHLVKMFAAIQTA